jgi:hypothetical protein
MPKFSHDDYARLLTDTVEQINSLSLLKGGEYAGDVDRLANFRRNAEQTGVPMETVWSVYYNKHHDAVMQFCRDLITGKERLRAEPLAGRVDDMITYLILFKAMLVERGMLELRNIPMADPFGQRDPSPDIEGFFKAALARDFPEDPEYATGQGRPVLSPR